MCMENIFEPKKDTNSQEGHGWMIEDGQLLFDRMSDPVVVMELIVRKCIRMCIGTECQWSFKMHSCKNQ